MTVDPQHFDMPVRGDNQATYEKDLPVLPWPTRHYRAVSRLAFVSIWCRVVNGEGIG